MTNFLHPDSSISEKLKTPLLVRDAHVTAHHHPDPNVRHVTLVNDNTREKSRI